MKKFIRVQWQFIGFHEYPKAPEEVAFLRATHRHVFKCSAKIEVYHDDRELEFFIVQHLLRETFGDGAMNHQSCEMIAEKIGLFLKSRFGGRDMEIEVSEDGENSAVVEL